MPGTAQKQSVVASSRWAVPGTPSLLPHNGLWLRCNDYNLWYTFCKQVDATQVTE